MFKITIGSIFLCLTGVNWLSQGSISGHLALQALLIGFFACVYSIGKDV